MKEPWEELPDVWKDAKAYFIWLRGQMRRAWSRHPIKIEYMKSQRVRAPLGKKTKRNPTGEVWAAKCEICNGLFRQTETEVDHIEEAGGFKDWNEFNNWLYKLLHINFDSIRIVCKPCHRILTHAARMGITFEEAAIEKEAIAFSKMSVKDQNKKLKELKLEIGSNAKLKKEIYKEYLKRRL